MSLEDLGNIGEFVAAVAVAVVGGVVYVVLLVWLGFSPQATEVGYQPEQPVPYSHALHAGNLGIDCRYCHVGVETTAKANVPPTATCMNCHRNIKTESEKLAVVRQSYETLVNDFQIWFESGYRQL